MLTRPFVFLSVALCGVSVGYPSPPSRTATAGETPETIHSDFYQTIIRNNLFAPLGTVLNQTPVPGANVKLIATFTRDDPSKASAIVENTATGDQKTVGVEDVVGGYRVLEIHAKQILIEKDGQPPIWKRLETFLLLNTRGR